MKHIMYQRILLTHDGSKLASEGIPHAVTLASKFNAEVILLQVVESVQQEMAELTPGSGTTIPVQTIAETAMEIVASDKKTAEQQLGKIADKLKNDGVQNVKVMVEEGLADLTIVEVAKSKKCD